MNREVNNNIKTIREKIIFYFLMRKNRRLNIKRLKNFNPTIVSNNCIGGIILHDLKLRFNTPTINLVIHKEDFIKYLKYLDIYSKCDLVQNVNTDLPYPVGILKAKPGDIQVFFQHFKTFEIAKKKWEERSKRIDYENIFVIMEGGMDITYDMLLEFERIPYKNKVIITDKPYPEIKSTYCIPIYDNTYYWGKILSYEGTTGKRFLDQFDYVSFLNRNLQE